MQLRLLGVNHSLSERLGEHFEDTKNTNDAEILAKEVEADTILIISDQFLTYDSLTDVDFSSFEYVFYLLSNSYSESYEKNIRSLCNMKDIELIPPRLLEEQIVDRILKVVKPEEEEENNVFSFLSIGQNIGTTTTTLNTAKALAERTEQSIGVLLLDPWDSGEVLLPHFQGAYLSEIKGRLSSRLYEQEDEFKSIFHSYGNMHVLGGNQNVRLERLFTKDEIHYLIERARETFDVVLIDAGSHFDNAVMIQVLEESSHRFMVVSQQYKQINRWNRLHQTLFKPLGYQKDDFMLIINQYRTSGGLRDASEIAKEYDAMLLTTIPFTKYGMACEGDNQFLYDYEDISFNESVDALARVVGREMRFNFTEDKKKRKKKMFALGAR